MNMNMSKQIGFIFIFSNQFKLKKFSLENKEKYFDKYLLHSLSIISHINNNKKGHFLIDYDMSIEKTLQTYFGLKKSYIVDFNPIPKKCVKSKNTLVVTVILNSSKKDKILKILEKSLEMKVLKDDLLLRFNLREIDSCYDLFTSIKNLAGKTNTLSNRKFNIYGNDSELFEIKLIDLINSLCGIEELREETKCYI